MKVNVKRVVLICTLGKTPQVITETVWALAHETPPIIPDEIIAITTAKYAQSAIEKLFGLSGGWGELNNKLHKAQKHTAGRLRFDESSIRIVKDSNGIVNDLRTVKDNERCADYLYQTVKLITDGTNADKTDLIFSLSGGRKSMCACASTVMSLLGRPQDTLIHLIADEKLEDGKYHFPQQGKGYSLFEVPFVRARGLIQGVDINKVKSFAECMRITHERLSGVQDYPVITIDTANASFTVKGFEGQSVTGIDGSRFLFLWLLFKMKSLDADRFKDIMCKAHALVELEGMHSWFRGFQAKNKFVNDHPLENAIDFNKVKSETKRDVLRKSGLSELQCEALYPRTKNGKPIAFEFGIAYPADRLHVVDTDFTRRLEKELLGNLS